MLCFGLCWAPPPASRLGVLPFFAGQYRWPIQEQPSQSLPGPLRPLPRHPGPLRVLGLRHKAWLHQTLPALLFVSSWARRAAVRIRAAGATPSTRCRRQLAAILSLPIEAHASDRARNYFETLGERAEKPIPAHTSTQAPGKTKRRVASASSSSSMIRPQSSWASTCGYGLHLLHCSPPHHRSRLRSHPTQQGLYSAPLPSRPWRHQPPGFSGQGLLVGLGCGTSPPPSSCESASGARKNAAKEKACKKAEARQV